MHGTGCLQFLVARLCAKLGIGLLHHARVFRVHVDIVADKQEDAPGRLAVIAPQMGCGSSWRTHEPKAMLSMGGEASVGGTKVALRPTTAAHSRVITPCRDPLACQCKTMRYQQIVAQSAIRE
jgi:hypothetical protein